MREGTRWYVFLQCCPEFWNSVPFQNRLVSDSCPCRLRHSLHLTGPTCVPKCCGVASDLPRVTVPQQHGIPRQLHRPDVGDVRGTISAPMSVHGLCITKFTITMKLDTGHRSNFTMCAKINWFHHCCQASTSFLCDQICYANVLCLTH